MLKRRGQIVGPSEGNIHLARLQGEHLVGRVELDQLHILARPSQPMQDHIGKLFCTGDAHGIVLGVTRLEDYRAALRQPSDWSRSLKRLITITEIRNWLSWPVLLAEQIGYAVHSRKSAGFTISTP